MRLLLVLVLALGLLCRTVRCHGDDGDDGDELNIETSDAAAKLITNPTDCQDDCSYKITWERSSLQTKVRLSASPCIIVPILSFVYCICVLGKL